MLRRPPISTRTDTLFPYTTLFRSKFSKVQPGAAADGSRSANMPRRLAPVSVKPGRDRFYPPIERAETKAGTAGQCRTAVFLRRMSGLGWGADGRLLSLVIPDLIRAPPPRRSHGPRIQYGVAMITRAAPGRTTT